VGFSSRESCLDLEQHTRKANTKKREKGVRRLTDRRHRQKEGDQLESSVLSHCYEQKSLLKLSWSLGTVLQTSPSSLLPSSLSEGSEGLPLSGLLSPACQLSPSCRSESHLVLKAQGNIETDAVSCHPSTGEDGVHH